MIYTTYFAKLRNLPSNVIPISICAKAPSWYTGLQYKKLAPKYNFFTEWKKTHDDNYYIEHFNSEVLSCLLPHQVLNDLYDMLQQNVKDNTTSMLHLNNNFHIALVCYEKPSDFCHRHLVAKWFCKNGVQCTEFI